MWAVIIWLLQLLLAWRGSLVCTFQSSRHLEKQQSNQPKQNLKPCNKFPTETVRAACSFSWHFDLIYSNGCHTSNAAWIFFFFCIACTILLYILYFWTEGHYGFNKNSYWIYFWGAIALVCMRQSHLRDKVVQIFSKYLFWNHDQGHGK